MGSVVFYCFQQGQRVVSAGGYPEEHEVPSIDVRAEWRRQFEETHPAVAICPLTGHHLSTGGYIERYQALEL